MGVGSIVEGSPLQTIDEIVSDKHITDKSGHVYELYVAKIKDCLDKIIRWSIANKRNWCLFPLLIRNTNHLTYILQCHMEA